MEGLQVSPWSECQKLIHTAAPTLARLPALFAAPNRTTIKRQARKEEILTRRILKKKGKRRTDGEDLSAYQLAMESRRQAVPNQILRMRERNQRVAFQARVASSAIDFPAGSPVPPPAKILPFLARRGSSEEPAPIVPFDLMKTFQKYQADKAAAGLSGEEDASTAGQDKQSGSIRKRTRNNQNQTLETGVLKLAPKVESKLIESSVAPPKKSVIGVDGGESKTKENAMAVPTRANGLAFVHGITPTEAKFVLVDAPKALTADDDFENFVGSMAVTHQQPGPKAAVKVDEQAEMVRRILSLENAGKRQINKWNRARVVELFGRKPFDTGSPEVQAAVLSVKIEAMRSHLEMHRKDMSSKRKLQAILSQRASMLKYLRRKDLPRFVETCRALGVEPDTIHA
ncbi:30S ribosomal protein S15 [Blyttiomyces sp. JEL0837]|nr:30S ribosomal protein S15 [Blyttiomyces sp. JEL0837]